MGTNYYAVKKKPTIASPMHIGKSSAGWRFSFQDIPRGFSEFDYELEIHTYNQWKKFLSENKEIIILDEYDKEISVEEFFKMVDKKQEMKMEDTINSFSKDIDGYIFISEDFS